MIRANDPKFISLEGCLNFRDLGGYTGEGGAVIRYGQVYRADDLSKLSPADITRVGELGVSVVIDLRSAVELDRAPNPLCGNPAFSYHHIPILDGLNSAPGGLPEIQSLPEMYKSLLSNAGDQIGRVFRILAGREGRGAVFHCTAGKDRTGVIAALILNLCGVADRDIVADYALTYERMRPCFDTITRHARQAGVLIPEHLLHSDSAFMKEFLAFLKQNYTGAESYLLGTGLSSRILGSLRDDLLDRTTKM
ncbi:MAG: tyrosine-protein phosphatase [Treponema sp.]|jgi:protein-tyrosine phosphatase|nr:tyrosine-protein phosphatase [Treponema sp.]